MKHILTVVFLLSGLISSAQDLGGVSGKVLDAEMFNEPLLMAFVSVKGTDKSVQTNFNGNFEIADMAPGQYTLEIAFLGYEAVTLPIEIKSGEYTTILQSLRAKSLTPGATTATTENISENAVEETLARRLK
ncbi:carboxypeptidase-like regulatory domain-containing protein [Maribacter sp. 2210JD10-5]|uniref:carboxypeptidase-like regulatory domain-containing protein n=1 Tax=Maribacter sp. 2210JD10-5 TaxID=3386272 RepID=UPI0039BCD6A0